MDEIRIVKIASNSGARDRSQGATLDEARENLHEAVALVLEANRALAEQSLEGA
jgi:hypothetical protein